MKTIFRATAPISTFLKSISVLMLFLVVTFSVTSCENQTKSTSTVKSEVVSASTAADGVIPVATDSLLIDIGDNAKIENRSVCFDGNYAVQEGHNLEIGGNGPGSTAPRNLLEAKFGKDQNVEIGGNSTERKLYATGGSQAPPRQLSKIGGNQLAPRQLSGIGGTTYLIGSNEIGGQYAPRS